MITHAMANVESPALTTKELTSDKRRPDGTNAEVLGIERRIHGRARSSLAACDARYLVCIAGGHGCIDTAMCQARQPLGSRDP
jgi:hypothetical protein